MKVLRQILMSLSFVVAFVLATGHCADTFGQTVNQPELEKSYNMAVDAQNAAVDSVFAIDGQSPHPQFKAAIDTAKSALAQGNATLAAARFNASSAAMTATAYALALKDGRFQDAQTLAGLWSKQAGLVKSQLGEWGNSLAAANTAIQQARQFLPK